MAGELQVAHNSSGVTLYALIRDTAGKVWQTTTSTLVAYATANLANYKVSLTEQGAASRFYAGNFPAAAAGVYNVAVYQQAGGSPAETDSLVAAGNIEWDGTAVPPISGIPSAILDAVNGIETNVSLRQALRLVLSVLAGKISGAGTTTITIRDINDSKNRVVAVVDGNGNRTQITFDVSP
jgi:hypothetical protein